MTDQTENQTDEAPNELTLLKQRAKLMGITHSNNITADKLRQKIADKLSADEDTKAGEQDGDDDTSTDDNAENPDVLSDDEIDDQTGAADEFVSNETAPPAVAPTPTPTPALADPALVTKAVTITADSEIDPAIVAEVLRRQAIANPNPFDHDRDGRPGGSLPGATRKMTKTEREVAIRKDIHDREMALVRVRIANLDPKKNDLPGEIFTVANEYLGTVRKFIPYGDATENGYHIPKCIYDQLNDRKYLMIRVVKDKRTGTSRPETRWVKEFSLEVLPALTQEELERLAIAQAASGALDEFA